VELQPVGYKILIEVLGRAASVDRRSALRFPGTCRGREQSHIQDYLDYLRHLLPYACYLPVNRFVRFALVGASGVVVTWAAVSVERPTMLAWV